MQSNYVDSFEKVSRTKQRGQKRYLNQGNPHRQQRKAKRQARYE